MKKSNKKIGAVGSKIAVNTNPNLAGPTKLMKNKKSKMC